MNDQLNGFRLHHVEICNWGVFDKTIFRISPNGLTTLLTGANGAGKTTYVEALLTLLVPERKMRHYNQASGATSRKDERTEESYVLGEIGMKEGGDSPLNNYLRPDKTKFQSYLLAVFFNGERYVSLAQIRWFFGSQMRRTYIVGRTELSIKDDLMLFEPSGNWKRTLKKNYGVSNGRNVIEDFDSPGKYAHALRTALGMKSEKALSLFSQTIGLKVLGNLNDFIRTNMLEPTSVEDDFARLSEGLEVLLKAHNEIMKSEEQLLQLAPIMKMNAEYRQLCAKVDELREMSELMELYFATRKQEFLDIELTRLRNHHDSVNAEIEQLHLNIEGKQSEATDLQGQLQSNDIGSRMRDLQREIKNHSDKKAVCQKEFDNYNKLAKEIRFIPNPTKDIFEQQKLQAGIREDELKSEIEKVSRSLYENDDQQRNLKSNKNEINETILQLSRNKNNITGRVAEIRQEILDAVGATEKEIPFVGELIQVSLSSKNQWEMAIERVLHNFALQMIVPSEYYAQVTKYVNENNLRGRVVYIQYKEEMSNRTTMPDFEDSLFSKLQLNQKSEYVDWVETSLKERFNFICTDDLQLFRQSRRAVTSKGLMKNDSRHEKDDRVKSSDRTSYVLGWDNKEKLRLLVSQMKELNAELNKQIVANRDIQKKKDALESEQRSLHSFLTIDAYHKIDFKSPAQEVSRLQKDLDELQKDVHLNQLKRQLNDLNSQIKQLSEQFNKLTKESGNLEYRISSAESQLKECLLTMDGIDLSSCQIVFEKIESMYHSELDGLEYSNILLVEKNVSGNLNRRKSIIADKQSNNRSSLERQMGKFINPDLKTLNDFPDWRNDTHLLSPSVDYIDEFERFGKKIEKEQLVESRKRFKKYLNDDMVNRMTSFQTSLENQREEIVQNIDSLNGSLQKIEFRPNPATYIQLIRKDDTSDHIRKFRQELRNWRPNRSQYELTKDDSIYEESFFKIKKLIEELQGNPDYRKLVTDVRNWMSFEARELSREDSTPYKVYQTTAKLSGGEKAQLTYTILGSALAYQFGINEDGRNHNSFRFICIDESFSNQDAEKANYLMQLCKQLHLQLLCVTPEDKTNIVEPHISAVHYVLRKNDRESVILDMPIRQFAEQREQYKLNQKNL